MVMPNRRVTYNFKAQFGALTYMRVAIFAKIGSSVCVQIQWSHFSACA